VTLASLLCLFALLPGATPVAHAITLTVNSKLDTSGNPSICTLRDAITAANTNTATAGCATGVAGLDTIGFNLGSGCNVLLCQILLGSTLPTVVEDLNINGAGSPPVISGSGAVRVFNLAAVTVNISNLGIAGGLAPMGGGIEMAGTTLTVTNVNFSNNHGSLAGGAIDQPSGTLNVVNSNFSDNVGGHGGGALVSRRMLAMTNSTFVNNSSNSDGGAIFLDFGEARLTNVTLSGNSAGRSGAGILVTGTTTVLSLNNVTISANTVDTDTNGSGPAPNHPDCSGTFLSFGYNLIGSNAGCGGFTNGTNADIVGTAVSPVNALLAPLANNGGATRTHALLAGSPALNSASPFPPGSGGFACAAADQRGVLRPQAATCDRGAYELIHALLYLPLIRR